MLAIFILPHPTDATASMAAAPAAHLIQVKETEVLAKVHRLASISHVDASQIRQRFFDYKSARESGA
jgi:hypothetical protein